MSGGETDLRDAFQESLNCAIAHGLRPSRWIGLGDTTFTAIEAIADEHPDATSNHISDAYDAFAREHGPAPVKPPPNRLEVQRRFKRRGVSEPNLSAADRATNLPEDQEHDADDEQNPADRGDDGG